MSDIKYEFMMSQIKHIRDIKETEKTKISLVYYEGCQGPCIFKICKNRDLSEVYQALMEIRHPNVAVVYDFVYISGNTYVFEEFIAGKTLLELLQEKKGFSEKETAWIIIDVCKGLEILHSQNPPVIHNDIKTSNIMVREDRMIKLFDFDISRTYKEGAYKNTRLMGTEEYAAPEHYGFGQSEPRTDIYSLGVTMHEMLTGQGLSSNHQMSYKGSMAPIMGKCIEIDPKKRYLSASALKHDLEVHLNKIRKLLLFAVVSLCCILLLTAGGALVQGLSRQQNNPGNDANIGDGTFTEDEKSSMNKETSMDKETESLSEEDENVTQNTETTQNTITSEVEEKEISVVQSVSEKLYTMIATNDGIFITLEEISNTFYLKTSEGQEKELKDIYGKYGARLVYDRYSDELYLFEYDEEETKIYRVTSELETEEIANISGVQSGYLSEFTCDFFSDGKLICNALYDNLLDSQNWTVIGSIGKITDNPWIINDHIYVAKYDFSDGDHFIHFNEIDSSGNIIRKCIPEVAFVCDFLSGEQIYVDAKYAYFIGSAEGKEYVYRFDGESYEAIACLNEYKYYGEFEYDYLCVTEEKIRCYDIRLKSIKEFEIK